MALSRGYKEFIYTTPTLSLENYSKLTLAARATRAFASFRSEIGEKGIILRRIVLENLEGYFDLILEG